MGDSPDHESIETTDDLVGLVERFVDSDVGDESLLLVGHSYGGHIARALAARRPAQIVGMALICPMIPDEMHAEPPPTWTVDTAGLERVDASVRESYTGYFVFHTKATAERFNAAVVPALDRYDGGAVERIMESCDVKPAPNTVTFDNPTLIVTGRHDAITGYRGAMELIDSYPRATFVVVEGAGHALPHERPEILGALITDWLTTI